MKVLAALCVTVALTLPVGAEAAWVTPAGKVLTSPECSAYRATAAGDPQICFGRKMTQSPVDLAACTADGGTPRLSDSMAPVLTCSFPQADAGKACLKSTDCELACDALTHECRAFSAMGQILDKNGRSVQVVN